MVQREMDGPGQQSWEAPPAEGNLRKANSGMALNSWHRGLAKSFLPCGEKVIFKFSFEKFQFQRISLELSFLVSALKHGCPVVPWGWESHWPILCWERWAGMPRYRHSFKPMLRNFVNHQNVIASFCWHSGSEICLMHFPADIHIRDADHQGQRELCRKLQVWGQL